MSDFHPSAIVSGSASMDILRLGMGVVWLFNLLFIIDPQNSYFGSFADTARSYAPSTFGGPGLADYVAAHATFFAWSIALTTGYLAIAFLLGLTTRLACFVGSLFSAVLFATQVGSTFVFPGGTDVGPHPLYILIYGVFLVGGAGRHFAVDPWLRRTLAAWWEAPKRARVPVPLGAFTQLSPQTVFVYFSVGTILALAIGFGLVVAFPLPPSSGNGGPVGPTTYVNLTIDINATNGWPQYTPANFTVPVGQVDFTIVDNDLPINWSGCPCPVEGTLGHVETINGSAVRIVPQANVAHSFSVPDLGIQVYTPGLSTVTFSVDVTHAGKFFWVCTVPCGTGADPYNSPPMGTPGFMAGTMTVT
ncbi:MAG: hypothetical protein ACHQ2Y_07640 [Candidatus Lutacidiplasmatales archaeon]